MGVFKMMSAFLATGIIDRDPFDSKLRSMHFRRSTLVTLAASMSLMGCRSGDDRSAKSRRNGAVVSGTGVQAPPVPWFPRAAPLLLSPGRALGRSVISLAESVGTEP